MVKRWQSELSKYFPLASAANEVIVIGALGFKVTSMTPQFVVKVIFFGSGLAALVGCGSVAGVCAFAVALLHLIAACAGAEIDTNEVAVNTLMITDANFFTLLPLDGCWRLACNVQNYSIYLANFICNPSRNLL